jgi:hypothetical protein
LPFVIYGALEHATGKGLIFGRILNGVLSLVVLATIVGWRGPRWEGRLLAACGLLACPYFIGTGLYLYSDAPATAFVTLGMLAYLARRHVLSGAFMALAIACRQYMVAFPVALALWALWEAAEGTGGVKRALAALPAWGPQVLAAGTILGWVLVFGGLAPEGAVEQHQMFTADVARIVPRNALYSLTCVGAYFVVVEAVLFRRLATVREVVTVRTGVWAAVLAVLFILFPPLANTEYGIESMGYIDKAARTVLGDVPRMLAFWGLAVLAAARFGRIGLAGVLVACNAAIMMKAHIGWDKYAVPLLAVLWLLKSRDALVEVGRGMLATLADGAREQADRPLGT